MTPQEILEDKLKMYNKIAELAQGQISISDFIEASPIIFAHNFIDIPEEKLFEVLKEFTSQVFVFRLGIKSGMLQMYQPNDKVIPK